ncbi:hypothetical protein ACFL0M_08465 [Thermodesulfobacteriota bacterium]
MQNNTETFYRHSPVKIEDRPKKVGLINGFEVPLEYEGESQKKGPALIDLSHLAKWDIQGSDLDQVAISREDIPSIPEECRIQNERIIFRMNRTQAGIWHICKKDAPELPYDSSCTDVTDAWALFGLVGKSIPTLFEHITELDLMSPSKLTPIFLQGPVFHLSSRIVVIKRSKDSAIAIIAFPRGFGQSTAKALLETGSGIGLHITGANTFFNIFSQIKE